MGKVRIQFAVVDPDVGAGLNADCVAVGGEDVGGD